MSQLFSFRFSEYSQTRPSLQEASQICGPEKGTKPRPLYLLERFLQNEYRREGEKLVDNCSLFRFNF